MEADAKKQRQQFYRDYTSGPTRLSMGTSPRNDGIHQRRSTRAVSRGPSIPVTSRSEG